MKSLIERPEIDALMKKAQEVKEKEEAETFKIEEDNETYQTTPEKTENVESKPEEGKTEAELPKQEVEEGKTEIESPAPKQAEEEKEM